MGYRGFGMVPEASSGNPTDIWGIEVEYNTGPCYVGNVWLLRGMADGGNLTRAAWTAVPPEASLNLKALKVLGSRLVLRLLKALEDGFY